MKESEIRALVRLLSDEDADISNHVESQVYSLGAQAQPFIQEALLSPESELHKARLTKIERGLRLDSIKDAFTLWAHSAYRDLFEGIFILCSYRYPELEKQNLVNEIDHYKLDVWLRMRYRLSPVDNVRIMNQVIFDRHQFHLSKEPGISPEHFYLNRVLEEKRGGSISLSVLYSIVAQKLYLPILGVDVPKHFLLAYKDDSEIKHPQSFGEDGSIPFNIPAQTLFYIDMANRGSMLSRYSLERYLSQASIDNKESFFEPCSNKQIVARLMQQLIEAYTKLGNQERQEDIQYLLDHLLKVE